VTRPRRPGYVYDDEHDKHASAYFDRVVELGRASWVWTCWDCHATSRRALGGRNITYADYLLHRDRDHGDIE